MLRIKHSALKAWMAIVTVVFLALAAYLTDFRWRAMQQVPDASLLTFALDTLVLAPLQLAPLVLMLIVAASALALAILWFRLCGFQFDQNAYIHSFGALVLGFCLASWYSLAGAIASNAADLGDVKSIDFMAAGFLGGFLGWTLGIATLFGFMAHSRLFGSALERKHQP